MMKKLALSIASLALASAPVLACPGHDTTADDQQAPRTADKDKAKEAPKPAKPAPKQDTKQADKAKQPAKPAPAKPTNDKVSQK